MASLPSLPEELKFINQYLQRGQETRKKEPVISYYCNYYAAKLALEKGTKDKESKLFLTKLLDILEQEKKELADNEAVTNDIAGEAYVENFALKVFTKADNEDRTGKATRNTAKTFLASSLYIELLKLFGNISPELEDRIKYAKWKAIDITKALKEGRTPVAGPPGGEPSLQQSGFEGNDQTINNNLPDNVTFSSAPISSDLASTTTPSLDGDTFPSFPSAPTQDQPPGSIIDTFSNAQDLASSFDNLDLIGKQTVPPLPPKVNDYGNFPDNPFAQQPSTLNYSPPPGANRINFYDTPPQLPPSIPHAGFTNDYVQPQQLPQQPHQQPRQQPSQQPHQQPPQQPHQQPPQQPSQQPHQQPHQQPPQQPPQQPHQQPPPPQTPLLPHSSFSPHPQAPPQNYTQPTNLVNPPHQHPSFSAPASYPQSRQKYGMYSYPQTPQNEIDPTTVATVQKYCKFASSALDYNDVKTAVGYMNKALETLKPYNQ